MSELGYQALKNRLFVLDGLHWYDDGDDGIAQIPEALTRSGSIDQRS